MVVVKHAYINIILYYILVFLYFLFVCVCVHTHVLVCVLQLLIMTVYFHSPMVVADHSNLRVSAALTVAMNVSAHCTL